MKVSEILYGFKVKKSTEITDIGATLFEAEHIKSGARLMFLEREDENKTFSITFKTLPTDSTGVFHIIEHSVLNGSKKYPVKEPFVELLKGSLNTFLNAMTFPDKTMYPVASRNDKDFLNLVSVYLDAVFHPAILEEPRIFYQEGWHYELDSKDADLKTSGVVLNEMRGAFSSPDEVASYHIKDMLFPDNCYKFESGGEPNEITDLTYEQFRDSHKKYYHPSNAEIFLDGSVDIDSVLPLIDEVLSEYERQSFSFDIPDQKLISPVSREIKYEIAPNESEKNKTRISIGYLATRFDEQEKITALAVLSDAIASTNEAPLKKAIIDSGLCDDFDITSYDSMKQNAIFVDFKNVRDGKSLEVCDLFYAEIQKLISRGIDKSMLEASLNSLEFKMREKDYGTLPIGVVYAMNLLEASLYGGDPAQNLSYEKSFKSIREKLSDNYFEALLDEVFIKNNHKATLIMKPSATLGKERTEKDAERLKIYKDSLSDADVEKIVTSYSDLKRWQEREDTPEQLKTLPQLRLEDIEPKVERIPESVYEVEGVTVLDHDIPTSGITYLSLNFDATDLNKDDIFDLRMLVALIGNVRTEARSAIELQNDIKAKLGSLEVISSHLTTQSGEAKIFVKLIASALNSKKQEIPDLASEILYTSIYKDSDIVRSILRQMKLSSEEAFTTGGHQIGITRSTAYTNSESAISEYFSGYEAHLSIKRLDKSFDSDFPALSARLDALARRIFVRERLTVSVTGTPDKDFTKSIIERIPHGTHSVSSSPVEPLGIRREGIMIPAQAAYAEIGANLKDLDEKYAGSFAVVRSILTYGHLWNAVRVQGGAYGVGLVARANGNVGFYSYRDPSPARSLRCYAESAGFLRRFAESNEDIIKFIIGAVGEASPLMTPKLKGMISTTRYLSKKTYEDVCQTLKEILSTDKAELLRIANIIESICNIGGVCIVADKEKLDTCELDAILEI